jgi:rSAM/selenodomain-associated transferase 2
MISVIIPTLNEGARLPRLLATLCAEPVASEIIVADGGSVDDTVAIAREAGVKVIATAPGRGGQIRAGAETARSDIFLFLHADSVFPTGGLARIEEALSDGRIVGGNFRLHFDGPSGFARWLTGFYAFIRWLGVYYGDSGVFVRRRVYDALGGVRPIALMEDFDFNRRLERAGTTCCIDEPPLITSSRRFAGRHPLAIIWGWIRIHALFYLDASPTRLARVYDAERAREQPYRPADDSFKAQS